ncbi:hypothetical protein MASR1M36_17070 [Candidatus Cloacimonadaceae bacterium]
MLLCISLSAEIRSVWVLPWDISSEKAVSEVVEKAVENNQNELLVEVRYRADALFDTSRGAYLYPNPEPRSYTIKEPGFDPLQSILQKAHTAGLQVQAWVIVFNATPLDNSLLQQNYLYKNHRDWFTTTQNGSRFSGNRQFGYFLDPGVPEVQDYLLDVIGNLAAGYPELDGIHLDYIRYPEAIQGYHPISVARYQEYCRNQSEIGYNEWRIMQVSGFVEKLNTRIKAINPKLRLSAAVFSDIADANVDYAQDWPDWLHKGIIDQVYPMAYATIYNSHQKQLERMKSLGMDDKIVIGHRAWDDKERALNALPAGSYNLDSLVKRIGLARDLGFAGVAMFSYGGLKPGNSWNDLKRLCFSEPMAYPVSTVIQVADSIPSPEPIFYPEARLIHLDARYVLETRLPLAGQWNWELWASEPLAKTQKHYSEGINHDILELDLPLSVSSLKLMLHIDKSDSKYRYIIPLELSTKDE